MLLIMWDVLFGSSPKAVLGRQLLTVVANSVVIGLSIIVGYTNWQKGGNAYLANFVVIPILGLWVFYNCRDIMNGTHEP